MVWETATPLHFNRDFRINSQPLAACLTPDAAIGGRAWPNCRLQHARWEKVLVLWANTTLGLIGLERDPSAPRSSQSHHYKAGRIASA